MKSYTNIEQSKKLAEILPLESADMGWNVFVDDSTRCLPIDDWDLPKNGEGGTKFIPCWSLAALLSLLPNNIGRYTKSLYWFDDEWYCEYMDEWGDYLFETKADNSLDACVEMILKLHELKLI